jgi:type I restriction enzyme R subunit
MPDDVSSHSNFTLSSERVTQKRIIKLFRDELHYRYLGNWQHRNSNSNIEENLLEDYLIKNGYNAVQIRHVIYTLRTQADNRTRSLYGNNQAVYSLLRYGVPVKTEADAVTESIQVINWHQPEKNDFAIAEEVTLCGNFERRPDIVLYVNGIAIGVLELKKSSVSISKGIRQNISNQQEQFNHWFFSTIQFVFAGNDSEGLRYGTIGTEEKYFLQWKEDEEDNSRFKLDKYLLKIGCKNRLIELMYDFVLFDGGKKKLPRVHQYFGIKAAQKSIRERKGGIIWHTQGSGKSIVMVLLAKWILENNPNARVAIITDRDDLDKQIERFFKDANETIYRTSNGRDLMKQLGQAKPRLLCSLIHKFGKKNINNFDQFIKELEAQPSHAVGEIFVFVDECHRTQSGKLHRVMKASMPNAVFIGFTGTPLLKKDKKTSPEIFGGYIHTYKYREAVEDGIVLDLLYEARDIDQRLGSKRKIDGWFDVKTKGLNQWQKDELKKQWGTMQKVLSSRSRMDRVVSDIIFDFNTRPCLYKSQGNAMLVASSIYEACKYYESFQKTVFKDKCAVVTSYNPRPKDITLEDTGADTETDKEFIYFTYQHLLEDIVSTSGRSKAETYEEWAKDLFVRQPANMKLLIVVDKLLTGFDAPSCTYLYIDKSMQDHALFQAICRTNRLNGIDKDFGYIVDYKNLFKKFEKAIAVYTSKLDKSAGGSDPQVMMKDRLSTGRERLDNVLEMLACLCEPVEPIKSELEYIHYFCGNSEIPTDLAKYEPQRIAFYKATGTLLRAYANISGELEAAGYSQADINRIKKQCEFYLELRDIIRNSAGEKLDCKAYEGDMRHLIDTYIEAAEPRKISPFEDFSLLELIVEQGIVDAIKTLPGGIRKNKESIAEAIENNIRCKITKEHFNAPGYHAKMSALLKEIISARKARVIEYEKYLKKIAELANKVETGKEDAMPESLKKSAGLRAIYSALKEAKLTGNKEKLEEALYAYQVSNDPTLDLAKQIDETVKRVRHDDWRDNQPRENSIKKALYNILPDKEEEVVEHLFLVIKQQSEY